MNNYKYLKTLFALIILFIFVGLTFASGFRQKAMGGIGISLPDQYNQLNLWQRAGNAADLMDNDSSSYINYNISYFSTQNERRRNWDALETRNMNILFYGQKRLSESQQFYAYFRFNLDNYYNLRYSIDRTPYDLDPFVLADSTEGQFNYYGPEIFVAYNYGISNNLFLGASIKYQIQQGLKQIYTMPEVIHRAFQIRMDLKYKILHNIHLGFSSLYYNIYDETKLVDQPDDSKPVTYRYRGEFEYKTHTGTNDRTAVFRGFELIPQIVVNATHLDALLTAGYFYRWHELFDSPTKQIYDGYYQGQHYYANLAIRFYLDEKKQTILGGAYKYRYIEDWAKEPKAGFLIYNAFYYRQLFKVGFSHRFKTRPITLAFEALQYTDEPDRRDHLAHINRSGLIRERQARFGIELDSGQSWQFRSGLYYRWYEEAEVWNYFGDLKGPGLTFGFGYYSEYNEVDFYLNFGWMTPVNSEINNISEKNQSLDIVINWKQFF